MMPDAKSENDKNGDSVSIRAPGGFEAKFRGRHLPNLIRFMIFLALALILVLGYRFQLDSRDEHASLKGAIDSQREAQQEMTYILTLKQEAREALNLSMPDSLRKRMRP